MNSIPTIVIITCVVVAWVAFVLFYVYIVIDSSSFFFAKLKGTAPWEIYMETGNIAQAYVRLKKVDEFSLGGIFFHTDESGKKNIDENLACALAAKANPEQFGCLSDPAVIDTVMTLRSWSVDVTVKSNSFILSFPPSCKITNALELGDAFSLEKKYIDSEELSIFVAKIKNCVKNAEVLS